MRLRIATWNMDHWKGIGRDPDHVTKAWRYVAELDADVVLLQEAVPPPSECGAAVFPSPSAVERWHSGGRAAFGTAVAVFGHEATEVPIGPLAGDRSARLTQTHPGAFVAARVHLGGHEIMVVSLYGMFEGPLLDKQLYSVTSMHRSLSDLTPLLGARSKMRILGGDWNVSTQFHPPHRLAHRVIFDRIAAFGLADCVAATAPTRAKLTNCICEEGDACSHVQTHRHPKSVVPWQNDYIFASEKQLMSKLKSCRVVADDDAWKLSDHGAVIAEFEL